MTGPWLALFHLQKSSLSLQLENVGRGGRSSLNSFFKQSSKLRPSSKKWLDPVTELENGKAEQKQSLPSTPAHSSLSHVIFLRKGLGEAPEESGPRQVSTASSDLHSALYLSKGQGNGQFEVTARYHGKLKASTVQRKYP